LAEPGPRAVVGARALRRTHNKPISSTYPRTLRLPARGGDDDIHHPGVAYRVEFAFDLI
jgi:hypothetical protein